MKGGRWIEVEKVEDTGGGSRRIELPGNRGLQARPLFARMPAVPSLQKMKATIPDARIAKSNVQQVQIGEVKIGPIAIEKLVIRNVRVRTSTGVAQMRNVRTALTLQFALDWKVGVSIDTPLGDVDFSRNGTIDLGALSLALSFGHIDLPGFANLSFDIPSLPVNNVSAVVGAIKNLNLGAVMAEQIRARDATAPRDGFQLTGLGLASVRADGLKIPAADAGQVTIGRVKGGALPLTNLTIPNLALPQATIPSLSSRNLDATTNPVTKGLHADAGLLEVTLRVTTTARLQVEELRVDNIKAAATVGAIELSNVVLPYEVLNLTLSQIGIESIEVPQLEVS